MHYLTPAVICQSHTSNLICSNEVDHERRGTPIFFQFLGQLKIEERFYKI